MKLFFLQVIDTISSGPEGLVLEEKVSIINLLMKGGVILIPIIILAFIAIYIFTERYLTIRKVSAIDSGFMDNIRDYVINNNIEAAKSLCRHSKSPIAKMIEKGVIRINN